MILLSMAIPKANTACRVCRGLSALRAQRGTATAPAHVRLAAGKRARRRPRCTAWLVSLAVWVIAYCKTSTPAACGGFGTGTACEGDARSPPSRIRCRMIPNASSDGMMTSRQWGSKGSDRISLVWRASDYRLGMFCVLWTPPTATQLYRLRFAGRAASCQLPMRCSSNCRTVRR